MLIENTGRFDFVTVLTSLTTHNFRKNIKIYYTFFEGEGGGGVGDSYLKSDF